MEGLAYYRPHQSVGLGGNIENDGLQLVVVHYAVCHNRFICLLGNDFAYQNARLAASRAVRRTVRRVLCVFRTIGNEHKEHLPCKRWKFSLIFSIIKKDEGI